jgi:hypothetical protein
VEVLRGRREASRVLAGGVGVVGVGLNQREGWVGPSKVETEEWGLV